MDSPETLAYCLQHDIATAIEVVREDVTVNIILPEDRNAFAENISTWNATCIDKLDVEINTYQPCPDVLTTHDNVVSEVLVSHLLKSNCLVTGQPDWGSIQIRYTGQQINQENLLRYLIGFREHNEFHEQCVERIFIELWEMCHPDRLSVYARYTRRGGLDINPFRASEPAAVPPSNIRHFRQ